jgi:CheY-like chemotaxis protein
MDVTDGADVKPGSESPDVLLVEADPKDARLVHCGLQRKSVSAAVVPDGRAAIDRLTAGSDTDTDTELPALVILDLNVSNVDGTTVLDAIKSSPRLETIPVIVLSDADEDIGVANDLGANAHLTKPADENACVALVESLAEFWFAGVRFPPEPLYVDRS